MTTTHTSGAADLPEALRLAEILEGDYCPDWLYEVGVDEISAELRRLNTYATELESQVILDCMTHDSKPLAAGQAVAPATMPNVLPRGVIRDVFMAHGFTVKDGQTDLKEYVYAAAYALLDAARAAQKEGSK